MSYQVSARKWRPQGFSEVMGQGHVVQTLKNAIQNNRVGHAYLFSGSRGVGKTTISRIFAKALNCIKGPAPEPCNDCEMCREITDGFCSDVIEIDGASNTGVDDVRELRENVKYASSKGRYKVYIIDEVHMLSKSAFNALLKTLEEPPAHVIFIFATTEPNRIPETIISRCQYFEFKRIAINDAVEQLVRITDREGIKVSREILTLIAKSAEGSMRDALVSLDQIVSFSGDVIKEEEVKIILGLVGREVFSSIIEGIKSKDIQHILRVIKDLTTRGIDLRVFCKEFLEYLRNLVIVKITEDPVGLTGLSGTEIERLKSEAKDISTEELQQMFNIILKTEAELRHASQPELVLEMALIKLTQISKVLTVDEILKMLENISASGGGSITGIQGSINKNRKEGDSISERVDVSAGDLTLTPDTYTSLWARIKESVSSKKPSLGGILEGMNFLKIKGDEIVLSFIKQGSESYYREKIELHKEIIGDTIREIIGKDLKIIFDTVSEKESLKENVTTKQAHTEIEKWKKEKVQEVLDIIPGVVVREMSGKAQGGVI
ncbi:MAG: DNA polymerase III subunit gamma/tau [Nitrospinae bacterium]|nr:DNA polymerase III subunit gamma/tau [Nitrospinota bacterium]